MRRRTLTALLLAAAALPAAAQNFPSRPIRIVVPYPAGGVLDVMMRAVAEQVSQNAGQPVIVDNKPGGNTNIAVDYVLNQPADGYTWFLAQPAFAINGSLFAQRWDAVRDFAPVARVALSADYLLVPAGSPVKTVAEYVAQAKAQPDKGGFGIPGMGSAAHVAFEQFKRAATSDITGVPYAGAPPIIPDVASGLLSAALVPAGIAMPHARSGRVRPIAIAGPARHKAFPDVPTLGEAGYPGIHSLLWLGIVVPVQTPMDVQRRISGEIEKALATPTVAAKIEAQGAEPAYQGPEQFGGFIKEMIETNRRVIQSANIKVQ